MDGEFSCHFSLIQLNRNLSRDEDNNNVLRNGRGMICNDDDDDAGMIWLVVVHTIINIVYVQYLRSMLYV